MTTATLVRKDIPLSQLVPSPRNARKRYDPAGIESLAASIRSHGLIQALLVKPNGHTSEVDAGGRRLRALQLLRDRGEIAADLPVKCEELAGDDATASEIGLADNVQRADLHPAEEVVAFAELHAGGKGQSAADIAARFGIPERRVRQRLALGSLSPKVLQAWQEGTLGHDATEIVEAFTLANSVREQEDIFKRLKKKGVGWNGLSPENIKKALGVANRDTGLALLFVGRAAYEAAGGKVNEDLFGDNPRISDPTKLAQLARDKLHAEAAKLTEAGWAWAKPEDEIEGYDRYSFGRWHNLPAKPVKPTPAEAKRIKALERLTTAEKSDEEEDDDSAWEADEANVEELDQLRATIAARAYTAADKAKSGCVLSIGRRGQLEIRFAVVKSASSAVSSRRPAALGSDGKKVPPPAVPKALMTRVSQQATEAARAAIVEEPRLGLAALLAGFKTLDYSSPIKVRMGDRVWSGGRTQDVVTADRDKRSEQYARWFNTYAEMSDADLLKAASTIAAAALDVQTFGGDAPTKLGYNAALLNAIDPGRLNKALRDRFDAADFFKSISGAEIKKAIGEAIPEDRRPANLNAMKKAALVKIATDTVPKTGWLPTALRTAHYDGPGAKAAAKKPLKKKPVAKKKVAAKKAPFKGRKRAAA